LARIIVVTHEYDEFMHREGWWKPWSGNFLLFGVLQAMARRGHSWRVGSGPQALPGDVAILHVNATRIGPSYLALARHYPVTINFGSSDISKRAVSGALLSRGAAWPGPVIIKSDLNFMGLPEHGHNLRAAREARPPPYPGIMPVGEYTVLPSIAEVAVPVWNDPALVVERFLPERDEHGYAARSWVFMGSRERCTRYVSADRIVKASNNIGQTAVPVPAALRAERDRLGFDYGKFDFVMHDGAPVLLDANRTPGVPPATAAARAGAEQLANGLEELIRRKR
jgi:hypothetical protein